MSPTARIAKESASDSLFLNHIALGGSQGRPSGPALPFLISTLTERRYAFALEIMRVAKMIRDQREYDLASQLWRAGTSIGANIEEAQASQSRADFRSKMSIAAKEARECHYWLRLTQDGKVLSESEVNPLIDDIMEIKRILTSIMKSSGS